jgi:hypothetical protein
MADRKCLIGVDNAMIDDNFTGDPESIEIGQRLILAALNMDDPDGLMWDQTLPDGGGWKLKQPIPVLISIAGFMLLFTQAERVSLRAARATDPVVDDFWELMLACSSGISLQHPVVMAGVQHLVDTSLLTAERAATILSGTYPS